MSRVDREQPTSREERERTTRKGNALLGFSEKRAMELATVLCSKEVLVSVLVLLATPLAYNLWKTFLSMWWRSRRIKRVFEAQGITCMPDHFYQGNLPEFVAMDKEARDHPMPEVSHDIAPRILPFYFQWSKKYGEQFVYWIGSQARFNLTNPEQAKEILSTKFGHYRKIDRRPDSRDLLSNGLAGLDGEKWAQHRRILNPAFFLEKLKAMAPTMVACTAAIIEKWDPQIEKGKAIDVHKEFKDLTADVISHTAFGSSFADAKRVFEMQHEQLILFNQLMSSVYIPGTRFLPTALNRYRWKINNNIGSVLRQLINMRLESIKAGGGDLYGNDLLGLMMAANRGELQGNQKNLSMGVDDIISECKIFFFAGHETTATLLTWTFLLLATSPEWQERTREEVQAVCGMTDIPTAESVNHLKIVGMVLNEALRLYPPVVAMFRKAATDMQLGKIVIPAGTELMMPIIAWHHDQKYWGLDANEFRPDRFSGGVAKACTVAGAFMPFSMGPRICIGQMFAMFEAKAVLSTILQRYRFCLSPTYRHAPTIVMTLQPEFGMPIMFEKL